MEKPPLSEPTEQGLPAHRLLSRFLVGVALLASVWFAAIFLYIAFSRLAYPFEIEWMEGAMVDHGARIAAGAPLYAAPSPEFIPFIYPPLYSYLLGLGYLLFDVNLWWGRLLSLLATFSCAGLAVRWVWLETRSMALGAIAAGLFLASFRSCGAWFDLNRVDMVRLALLGGGMLLLVRPGSDRRLIGSALLLGLAFFAKQFALIFLCCGALLAFARSVREGLLFSAVGFGVAIGGTLLLVWLTDGWFWYYCFELPFRNGMIWSLVGTTWREDVVYRFPFLLGGAALLGLAWLATREHLELRRVPVVLVTAGCGVAASFSARIHFGGYDNALIPMAFFTAIFLAVSAGRVAAELGPRGRSALMAFFAAIALLQFYSYDYAIRDQIPTAAHVAQGERFLEAVREIPGDVALPFHGYYWSRTGKRMGFHVIGLHDELTSSARDEDGEQVIVADFAKMPPEIFAAFEERRFAAVLSDPTYYMRVVQPLLQGRYRRDPAFGRSASGEPFPTLPPSLTGMDITPTEAWTPLAPVTGTGS